MFSILKQEKTALRDSRGMTVYRRLYFCDAAEDVATLPVNDAPGSGALAAEGGAYLLNHKGEWIRCEASYAGVSGLWNG